MIDKLREKLRSEGRSVRWFLLNYLPDSKYFTVMKEINKFVPLKIETEKAIKKYLGEK